MRQAILTFITLLTFLTGTADSFGMTAGQLLEKASAACRNAGGVEADFILMSGGKKTAGKLKFSGSRFTISTAGGPKIWYNGRNLYTYSQGENEVTIESPSGSDLAVLNPYAIILSAPKIYSAELMASKSAGLYRLKLTPRVKRNGAAPAEVYIEKKSLMPVRLVTTEGGKRVGLEVKKYVKGKKFTSSEFVFPAKKYPGVKTIDLR